MSSGRFANCTIIIIIIIGYHQMFRFVFAKHFHLVAMTVITVVTAELT